jgi:hypothetical protein
MANMDNKNKKKGLASTDLPNRQRNMQQAGSAQQENMTQQ